MYAFAMNDAVNCSGFGGSILSAYEMEAYIRERRSRWSRVWRMVVAVGLIVLGIAVSVLTLGAGLKKGLALGGIAGIVLAGLTIAGAGYTIVNSIASIAELFSNHGCNFMRDGLFGGNVGLHRAVSLSAGLVMLAGGIVGKKLAGVKVNAAKMGKGKQALVSSDIGSASNREVKVIGKLSHTKRYKGKTGYDVLNDPNWNLEINDAWVQSGIDNKQTFLVVSKRTKKNLIVQKGVRKGGSTVFARELNMLNNAGYIEKGNFLMHPSNFIF